MKGGRLVARGNVFVEKGVDTSMLLVSFNSAYPYHRIRSLRNVPKAAVDVLRLWGGFEFGAVTDAMACSRIMCRDTSDVCYHAGFGTVPEEPSACLP